MRASCLALPALVLLLPGPARGAVPFARADLYREGRAAARVGEFERAAAAFQDMVRAEIGKHALQLAVVCEADTLARLVDAGGSDRGFFFLPASVGGRTCYRALWGVYETADTARAATSQVPQELLDSKKPPFPTAVATLLDGGGQAPALREEPHPATVSPPTVPSVVPAPAPPPARKVFTDADLASYRTKREADESKYGTPKPLFEEVDLRQADKQAAGKKATPPPKQSPPEDDGSYWRTLIKNAKDTVAARREALEKAERQGALGSAAQAKQDLKAAEQALEELKQKALAKGAKPEWMQ